MQNQSRRPYIVHTPITALKAYRESSRHRFVTIPPGSVIDVIGTSEGFNLVDIQWEDKRLTAFVRDVEERTKEV